MPWLAGGKTVASLVTEILEDADMVELSARDNASIKMKPFEAVESLSVPLRNHKGIKKLDLSDCGITDEACSVLAALLRENDVIEELILEKNRIGSEGATALADALRKNKGLHTLNLLQQATDNFGEETLVHFVDMFNENITLTKIMWRLQSRQSFMLSQLQTRNVEIKKRRDKGEDYTSFLPDHMKPGDGGIGPQLVVAPTPSMSVGSKLSSKMGVAGQLSVGGGAIGKCRSLVPTPSMRAKAFKPVNSGRAFGHNLEVCLEDADSEMAMQSSAAQWPDILAKKEGDVSPENVKKIRRRLMYKFRANMMLIKREYKTVGGTLFMASYPEYLRVRDSKAGNFKVELAKDHDRWKECVAGYVSALEGLPSSKDWNGVHWVGSTAVDGLVSKPIVDLLIMSKVSVETTLLKIAEEMVGEDRQNDNGLMYPIGFFGIQFGVDWGFLQMPAYHANERGLMECNLHIFPDGVKVATEKILMRDFLNSDEGQLLKIKYSQVKEQLEAQIKRGELAVADYNKGKNAIIAEILKEVEEWGAKQPAQA